MAADRDAITARLHDAFGLDVAYHDPHIEQLDLVNAVIPVGDQFLEVIAPTKEGTTADRFRQRQGGDAGYMLIFQTDDHAAHRAAVDQLGVRVVADYSAEGFTNMQLHPADTGGTFFEIDQQEGDDAWHPAGRDWQRAVRTDVVIGITAVMVRCHDPEAVARRWGELLLRTPTTDGAGACHLDTDDAVVHFVPTPPDTREGIEQVTLTAADPDAAGAHVDIAGVRFELA
ncbi:MAG: VOC family protein [Ilumatobacter sp.]|nr:VOC family protein [Ilumatobacter sp.]